jgi:predicted  nucleic acid-binding Zn-ribbon protein
LYSLCIQALQEELESVQREGEKKDEALNRLEQQLHDAEEEKQLAGKKGAAVMKDLQRQLAAERKRAEKLQDRIRDILNEGTRVNTGSFPMYSVYNRNGGNFL